MRETPLVLIIIFSMLLSFTVGWKQGHRAECPTPAMEVCRAALPPRPLDPMDVHKDMTPEQLAQVNSLQHAAFDLHCSSRDLIDALKEKSE